MSCEYTLTITFTYGDLQRPQLWEVVRMKLLLQLIFYVPYLGWTSWDWNSRESKEKHKKTGSLSNSNPDDWSDSRAVVVARVSLKYLLPILTLSKVQTQLSKQIPLVHKYEIDLNILRLGFNLREGVPHRIQNLQQQPRREVDSITERRAHMLHIFSTIKPTCRKISGHNDVHDPTLQ